MEYRSAVIVIGAVYADDVPREHWSLCRDADLVLGRKGTTHFRAIKDRHGGPRDIDGDEWDRLYVAVKGEKKTVTVGG